MKWRKQLIAAGIVALATAAGLILTACSKEDDTSAAGKVTIEYFNQKREMADTLKEIIKDFEAEILTSTLK